MYVVVAFVATMWCVHMTHPHLLSTSPPHKAVTFLVIHQKNRKTLEEITNDLCPVLSVQQLYRISTMYWDDRYGTETVSTEVLNRMKQLMMDNNTTASHSFLLDDDSSIPFTPEDVANLMDDKVGASEEEDVEATHAHSIFTWAQYTHTLTHMVTICTHKTHRENNTGAVCGHPGPPIPPGKELSVSATPVDTNWMIAHTCRMGVDDVYTANTCATVYAAAAAALYDE